jgi:hypothetical protein
MNRNLKYRARRVFREPILFVILVLLLDSPSSGAVEALIEFIHPISYEMKQSIAVTNHDVSQLELLELNLAVPLAWPEQDIHQFADSGDQTFRLRDVHALGEIVRSLYRAPEIPPRPSQSRSLSVMYRLSRREIRTNASLLADMKFPPYDESSAEYRLFTQSEKSIEVDASEIMAAATRLKDRSAGPYRFARAVYEYVLDKTEYEGPSPSRTALECLTKHKGDCGTYSTLFVALCRAGGVPARPVAGCWAMGDNQWHCWAEFQLPGVGWVPVDPSVGDRGPREREHYFGNLDNNRVTMAKTFNLSVDTNRGSRDVGFVQVGTWWRYPKRGSSGSKMAVEHSFTGRSIHP